MIPILYYCFGLMVELCVLGTRQCYTPIRDTNLIMRKHFAEPPEYNPGITTLPASDSSGEGKAGKDTKVIRDVDLLPLAPEGLNVAAPDVTRKFTEQARSGIDETEVSSASQEDSFVVDDTFQDQGPGSVEVYKLDLRRGNSLLVSDASKQDIASNSPVKNKIPKKALSEEIQWKLKPIEPSKKLLPSIFREPSILRQDKTPARESSRHINGNRKNEAFAIGGVPELQVGCEGLEALERQKRSYGPHDENSKEDTDDWKRLKDPVYRESKDPDNLDVTPVFIDFDDELPSGELYEEMDELLKLKNFESTSPQPSPKRRADIDPALDNHKLEDPVRVEKFPDRGDLGPIRRVRSINLKNSQSSRKDKPRFQRETKTSVSSPDSGVDIRDTSLPIIEKPSKNSGRRLLWASEERENRENEARAESDLWGFGEDDGMISDYEDSEDDEVDKLRDLEMEKRRREYERRKQEELARRSKGAGGRELSRNDVDPEAVRNRQEHERQLERERQRLVEERRRQEELRRREEDQRKVEETRRQREEESRRKLEEERRRNRDPSQSRRYDDEERRKEWSKRREEEEKRRILENERNRQLSPSETPIDSSHRFDNRTTNSQEMNETLERKLQEYMQRNHPIAVKRHDPHSRTEEESTNKNEIEERMRYMEEQRRRQMEEQRRRDEQDRIKQIEEERRRQSNDEQKRREIEEQHRRQHQEAETRRQMEEQRRRRPDEEDRRTQIEEQRRRQHQEDERRRQMEEEKRRKHQEPSEDQRRKEMEEQRRRDDPEYRMIEVERRRLHEEEQRKRQQQEEEKQRQMEGQRRKHQQPLEDQRRNRMEEQRRRGRLEDRTMEDERRRLHEEEQRRWQQQEQERRRQMEEQRRRHQQPSEDQRRKEMEEQRRRDRLENEPMENERRRRLEEERKLQEYIKRNQPIIVPRPHNTSILTSAEQRNLEEQQRVMEAARQYDRNRQSLARPNYDKSRGPSAPTNAGYHQSQAEIEEERRRESPRRRTQEEEYRRAAERQHAAALRRERERQRTEQTSRRNYQNRTNSEERRPNSQDSRPSRLPTNTSQGTPGNWTQNQAVDEWKRRSEEHERQRQQHEERERQRIQNERNSRNNGHRRPQHIDNRSVCIFG